MGEITGDGWSLGRDKEVGGRQRGRLKEKQFFSSTSSGQIIAGWLDNWMLYSHCFTKKKELREPTTKGMPHRKSGMFASSPN